MSQLGLVAGFILAAVVGVLTLTPVPAPQVPQGFQFDKVYHLIAFAAVVFPVIATGPRRWVWVVPLAMVYGGAIEIIQPYVNRERELMDFVANCLGVMLGTLAGFRVNRRLSAWFGARAV